MLRLVASSALACGLLAAAHAHHSFPVHFDGGRIVSVSGVVSEFRFRNPHGMLYFTSEDADGGTQEWRAETNSPNILRRRGWSEDTLKPGDRVTVEGYPARDESRFMRVYRVLHADGREIIGQRPGPAGVSDDGDD